MEEKIRTQNQSPLISANFFSQLFFKYVFITNVKKIRSIFQQAGYHHC